MDVAPYSPIALAKARTVPDAIPGPAVGMTTVQKILLSLMPSVLPAAIKFTSTCSNAARAFRYISGNAITDAAITQPFQVCTILISKLSSRNAPNGRLRLNSKSRMKPATVGGSTRGMVRIPSSMPLEKGFIFITSLAKNIPRKNAITVAVKPVFNEIHKGLQFISARNSLILI